MGDIFYSIETYIVNLADTHVSEPGQEPTVRQSKPSLASRLQRAVLGCARRREQRQRACIARWDWLVHRQLRLKRLRTKWHLLGVFLKEAKDRRKAVE